MGGYRSHGANLIQEREKLVSTLSVLSL